MAARKAEVIITCDGAAAKQVLEGINRELQKAIKEREQLLQKQKQNGTLTQDEIKRDRELKKYIDSLTTAQQKSAQEMRKYADVMKDLAGAKTKDLKKALGEVKRALDNMSAKDPGRKQLEQDLKRIQKQIDANTVSVKKNQGAWGALGTTMKNLFAYAGIFAAFNKLKSLFEEVIQKSREMSDQLANIRKVSGLAMSDITQLTKNLAKIDTRSSIKELNELAYVGSKLGFGNYGIEGLESFVKSAVKVNNALKEDLGEDSMMAISKLVEVMGLIPKMGVEKAMDSAGSAIFKLASTSTATGGNIIEFSKRLMGLANVSHITTDQLLALGSASDAMGLMPEVSATAFNKVFTSIQSNTKAIETSLQMQKGELTELINQGKTMEAIVTVFDKMHGMNMDQLKSQGVFKALGSDGARLNNVMITMSDRIDMLKTHLHTSNQAFSEGSAVAQEYAIQMETAEAYMQRAANMWEKAFVNPEGIDLTKEFAKAWYDVSKSLTQTESSATVIKIVLQGIFGIMKLIVEMIPTLITGFATWGMWAGGAALISKIRELGGLIAAISTAIRGLSFAGWAGIIAGVAMGVATLYSHFKSLNEEMQRNSEFMKGFKKDLSDLNTEYGKGEAELRRYKKAIDEANKGTKQRQAAIQTFNSKFGQYMKNLLTEKSTAIDVANAYNEVTKALRAKLALQLKEKDINEQVLPREQWRAERRTEYEQRAQAAGLGQYGADWITGFAQDNQGKNINDLVRQIGKQYYNLPQQIIDEVATQAAAGNREFNNYGNIINSKFLDKANALLAAGSFLRQDRSAENAMRKVNKKWKPEQDAIDSYLADQNKQEPITPIEDRLTKEEIAAAKKAESEAKQRMRKDMKDAQEASTGILSKLEEYYRLQETAIQEARADGQLTEDQAKEMVRSLNIMKNESLATARRAITTGETEDWDKLKTTILPAVMSDTSEVSRTLLETIQKVAVDKLHSDLAKFNGDEKTVFGLDSRAFFDQMNAKAAGNSREAARLRAKIQNEVEKALLQYQFVEKANQQMRKDLEAMGITTETYEQFAKRMQAGIMEKQPTITTSGREITDEQAYREMGNKFVEMGVINFRYNIDNEEEARQWVKQFATDARGDLEGWAQAFPQLSEWIDIIKRKEQGETLGEAEQKALEEAMPAIRNLFNEMMNHADRLDKAMKDAFQHEKELQESRFKIAGYTDQEKEIDKTYANQAKQQETGAGQSFAQMLGLGSIAQDPEILQIQNRIYWRQKEVDDARQRLDELKAQQDEKIAKMRETAASEAEIHAMEQQYAQDRAGLEQLVADRQAALTEQMQNLTTKAMQEMQNRVNAVKTLTKPFADAANSIGKKLGDMIRGAEEDSITWEEIWKNMLLAVAESVIQMGAQYAENIVMLQSFNRASEAETMAHTTTEVTAGIAAGSAKTIGQLGWWGIPLIAVISALLMGLLQAALSTSGKSSTNNASAKKVKLASGMLTYDEGNVQTVVGDDGRVYRAREQRSLPEGVSMVTEPIATRVNGQQALVGERGPEIVIGRRTTRAIQMNRPDLLRDLALIDRGITTRKVRTFDEGNLSDMATAFAGQLPATQQGQQGSEDSPEMRQTLDSLSQTVAALSATVLQLQKNGIPAHIRKYGAGGLIDEVQSGLKFVSKYK